MMSAMSFALYAKLATAEVICVEQHMSILFNLGGRVRNSSNTRLSYFFVLGFNIIRISRLLLNHSLAPLSITFRCSADMMVRSHPLELRVGYGCRLKPVGSALTRHVIT